MCACICACGVCKCACKNVWVCVCDLLKIKKWAEIPNISNWLIATPISTHTHTHTHHIFIYIRLAKKLVQIFRMLWQNPNEVLANPMQNLLSPFISLTLWFSREGNGNPLQYSCLENPLDKGAWWAAVYGVAQSRTRLKQLSSSSSSGSFGFHCI